MSKDKHAFEPRTDELGMQTVAERTEDDGSVTIGTPCQVCGNLEDQH